MISSATVSTTICGRNASTVPAPPRMPSHTSEVAQLSPKAPMMREESASTIRSSAREAGIRHEEDSPRRGRSRSPGR